VSFNPLPGQNFKLICQSNGLPTLTAETTLPRQPVILNNAFIFSNGNVQFNIVSDTSAYLYDIYLINGSNQFTQRIAPSGSGNTLVTISTGSPVAGAVLLIYAYDKNLSEYFTQSNLFIKPNTYRPPFTTVENGYGCFGSLNILSIKLIN
jgi:hypothetical protein